MWVVRLQINACAGECIMNSFELNVSSASECICKQTTNWVTKPFNMQSEFTALQVAIHDLSNELELLLVWTIKKILKLNKSIIEMAKVQLE